MIPRAHPTIVAYSPDAVAAAARLIGAGQPVAVPTETVYGLAADATNAAAVARIYQAKGRPAFNPLIVHVPDLAAAQVIGTIDGALLELARAHWPGPLTLVVPLRTPSPIASLVTAGLPTIALRVPAHRAMQALLAASGVPLAAPSANASGRLSPTRAAHVAQSLGDAVPFILDDGPCPAGLESTIVGLEDGVPVLLRAGPLDLGFSAPKDQRLRAPGALAAHYAPQRPLRLDATQAQGDELLIGFGPVAGELSLSPTGSLTEAAAALFDLLHCADASGRPLAVAPIPDTGLGRAINDRLARAAVGGGQSSA